MPVCPQCDNRPFATKEALLQHLRTSSAPHPSCTRAPCERRFTSQMAYDAHMAAKHPPTFDCMLCNRPYHAPFALEDHYRGSNLHPNCTKCGRGFMDQAACDEHRLTMHPKTPCAPCGGKIFYEEDLGAHYWDSPNHPKCLPCKTGCKDDISYIEHMCSAHPEQHCTLCSANFDTADALQAHFWASPSHPKCDRCKTGFLNYEAKESHLETVHTPTIVVELPIVPEKIEVVAEPEKPDEPSIFNEMSPLLPAISQQISETSTYSSTGFTPLSPRNPMQSLIVGERRINSPDLRLELGFSPIINAKPPFSPAGLPRPGHKIEEIWSSTENVQVPPPTRIPQFTTPPRTVDPYMSRIGYYTHPGASSSSSSSSTWFDSTRTAPRLTARLSPPRAEQFHPRLYPGSVRAASLGRQGPLTEVNVPTAVGPPRGGSASVSGNTAYPYALPFAPARRPRAASSEIVNWEDLMGASPFGTAFGASDAASTAAATPQTRLCVVPQHLLHSPSLATISSPASSALENSPIGSGSGAYEADTRPTTASSTPSHAPVRELAFVVTPSSECPSSIHAPDLDSPISLRSLPSMSPLAGTPIDIECDDIPAAAQPLPASPTEVLSPVTVVDELPGAPAPAKPEPEPEPQPEPEAEDQDHVVLRPPPAASPLSTTSAQSYVTSPQEQEMEWELTDARAAAPSPVPAPMPELTLTPPHELETAELERAFNLEVDVDVEDVGVNGDAGAIGALLDTAVASPVTPVAPERGDTEAVVVAVAAVADTPKTNPNPLHCRACLADVCDDITATMCGHIFCNRCITDAVIKTSRCPMCMTPTLLYCLFRLDLAA